MWNLLVGLESYFSASHPQRSTPSVHKMQFLLIIASLNVWKSLNCPSSSSHEDSQSGMKNTLGGCQSPESRHLHAAIPQQFELSGNYSSVRLPTHRLLVPSKISQDIQDIHTGLRNAVQDLQNTLPSGPAGSPKGSRRSQVGLDTYVCVNWATANTVHLTGGSAGAYTQQWLCTHPAHMQTPTQQTFMFRQPRREQFSWPNVTV